MGKPLVIGNRHKRYTRVANKRVFDENFDAIDWGKKSATFTSAAQARKQPSKVTGPMIIVK